MVRRPFAIPNITTKLAAAAAVSPNRAMSANAASFVVMFGMANGLRTVARGAVPLALFGAAGYGHIVGRIGGPFLAMHAIAPVVLTFVAERASDAAVLAV